MGLCWANSGELFDSGFDGGNYGCCSFLHFGVWGSVDAGVIYVNFDVTTFVIVLYVASVWFCPSGEFVVAVFDYELIIFIESTSYSVGCELDDKYAVHSAFACFNF